MAVTLVPETPDEPRGVVTIGEQELGATDLAVRLPAGILEMAWQGLCAALPARRLVVTTPSWRRVGARVDGALDARWEKRARVVRRLVALRRQPLTCWCPADGGATRVALRNRGGDVAIDGERIVRTTACGSTPGSAPAPGLGAPLAMIVRSLGTVEPDGRVHVTWQARR